MIAFTHRTQHACLPHRFSFPSCLPICCELCINLSLRRSVNRCGVNQSLGFPFISPSFQWLKREREREKEEEGALLHYQHTHTHTGYITLWKQCREQWEVGSRRLSAVSSFFSVIVLWLFSSFFRFYPSSWPGRLRGCILKHESDSQRRVLIALSVKTVCFPPVVHPSVTFSPLDGDWVFVIVATVAFKDDSVSSQDHRGNIFSTLL